MDAKWSRNAARTRSLAHISGLVLTLAKLLILRASNLCKQGVAGSIPATSTTKSRTCGLDDSFCDVVRDVTAPTVFFERASSACLIASSRRENSAPTSSRRRVR
jgi:hypothetical protein